MRCCEVLRVFGESQADAVVCKLFLIGMDRSKSHYSSSPRVKYGALISWRDCCKHLTRSHRIGATDHAACARTRQLGPGSDSTQSRPGAPGKRKRGFMPASCRNLRQRLQAAHRFRPITLCVCLNMCWSALYCDPASSFPADTLPPPATSCPLISAGSLLFKP